MRINTNQINLIRAQQAVIVALFLFLIPPSAFAGPSPKFWAILSQNVQKDSIADSNQLKELYSVVRSELTSKNSTPQSLVVMNQKLRELELPEIKVDAPSLKVRMTTQSSFLDSVSIGVEVSDGSYRYCLPCLVGYNDYEVGVLPVRQPANPDQPLTNK